VAVPDSTAGEHLRLVVEERAQRFAESRDLLLGPLGHTVYPLVGRLVYADAIEQ
jgi:hypothetical protein